MNHNLLQNKNILITGGTGSLGRELVREVFKHDPKVVRVFDVDETEQFEFHHELKEHEGTVRFLLGAQYGITPTRPIDYVSNNTYLTRDEI